MKQMKVKEFEKLVISELKKNNVPYVSKEYLDGYGGWFNWENPELCICTSSPVYFETLVHEYCHFLQWKNERKKWNRGMSYCDRFFLWLDGDIHLTQKQLQFCHYQILKLELDCEKKTIDLIKKLHIDIDVEKYIKMSNVYMWSYQSTIKHRHWAKKTIYLPNIVNIMPNVLFEPKFYMDLNNLPVNALNSLNSCYFVKNA